MMTHFNIDGEDTVRARGVLVESMIRNGPVCLSLNIHVIVTTEQY